MEPPTSALRLVLPHGRGYAIYFDPLDSLPGLMVREGLRVGRCLVITDENVASRYLEPLERALGRAGWIPHRVVLPAGESTKSMAHLVALYDEALGWGIDRKTPVLALGGGVVGDLAGFAAATLLRGLPLVQLPTTLIAQVDSAIGGKTGINHRVGKNLIGAFHQPTLVCIDLETVQTLPRREWTSGLAELVKHALIGGGDLFERLRADWEKILQRDREAIRAVVRDGAAVKVAVVGEDEREQGRRVILNFGHTFGHALEKVAGYGTFTHGEAVALGMQAALLVSARCHPDVDFSAMGALVSQIPVEGTLKGVDMGSLVRAMYADKKVDAQRLRLVLLRDLGEAYLTDPVSEDMIQEAWAALFERNTVGSAH